jgi:hypothetical protein
VSRFPSAFLPTMRGARKKPRSAVTPLPVSSRLYHARAVSRDPLRAARRPRAGQLMPGIATAAAPEQGLTMRPLSSSLRRLPAVGVPPPRCEESRGSGCRARRVAGTVDVSASPDGTMTVVSVDVATEAGLPDGLVDHAFRVQHEATFVALYRGPGQITYRRTSLIVETEAGNGWVFALDDRVPRDAVVAAYPVYQIVGLSRSWGPAARQTLEDVAQTLAGRCTEPTAPLSDPACDHCTAGGGTETYCSITCGGDGGCSANCAQGYVACCNCPGSCRCCRQ